MFDSECSLCLLMEDMHTLTCVETNNLSNIKLFMKNPSVRFEENDETSIKITSMVHNILLRLCYLQPILDLTWISKHLNKSHDFKFKADLYTL